MPVLNGNSLMKICNILCFLYSNLLNKIAIRKSPYSSATPCTYMLLPRIWGAALLIGRSPDRFPVVSLGNFFRGTPERGRLSLWKWVTRISSEVKAAGAFGWRPTTIIVPNVKKIRGLNLPGTPWPTSACCGRPLLLLSLLNPEFGAWGNVVVKALHY